jgi:hypothetical protein
MATRPCRPRRRAIQYAGFTIIAKAGDYWMPRFPRGMTLHRT